MPLRTSSILTSLLRLLCLAVALPAAAVAQDMKLKPVASFPLSAAGLGPLLPVTLDGQRRVALLDTGSTGHFLDQALADKLGPALPDATGDTAAGRQLYHRRSLPDSFRIGPLPGGVSAAALFDTRELSAAAGEPVCGTLGLALMRGHCWVFDFDEGRLTVGARLDPPDADAAPAPGDSLLYLPVELPGGGTVSFMLDTGASGWGTLEAKTFDALAAAGAVRLLPDKVALHTSAGRVPDCSRGTMDGLKLNGTPLPRLTLVRSNVSRIGWKLFSSFNWQIDLSRSEIFLLPRQKPAAVSASAANIPAASRAGDAPSGPAALPSPPKP